MDRDALQANIHNLQKIMDPAEVAFVVKANAYGHGIPTVVPAAMAAGQRTFATFSAAEAERVRRVAPGARIIIMGHLDTQDIPWATHQAMEITVSRQASWQQVMDAEVPARIHLEVETGMHRTGLPHAQALQIARQAPEDVTIAGTCSHLAGAERAANAPRVEAQAERFIAFLDALDDHGIAPGQRHLCSSSAALLHPQWRFDMVRLGIALYGHWPTREVRDSSKVAWKPQPALSWRSRVWSVQRVPQGAWIGYGQKTRIEEDADIAIVPVGYGDGFARGLSDNGQVLIHGKRCPIVGMVNMNMIQVDVTGHAVEEGDHVTLIGKQGDDEIEVQSFAEEQDMVNYELMARLAQHIPRRGA